MTGAAQGFEVAGPWGGFFGGIGGGIFGEHFNEELQLIWKAFSIEHMPSYTCFVKGTLVYAKNGYVPIQSIKVGDSVLTYNFKDTILELCRVKSVLATTSRDLYKIQIGGKIIIVTGEHPFYVIDKGWVKVKDLILNDKVKSLNYNGYLINRIDKMYKLSSVYNIEVEKNKDYFITRSKLLVHNKPISLIKSRLTPNVDNKKAE